MKLSCLHSGTPRLVKEKEELKDWLARQKKIHQVFVIIFLMAMVIFLVVRMMFMMTLGLSPKFVHLKFVEGFCF